MKRFGKGGYRFCSFVGILQYEFAPVREPQPQPKAGVGETIKQNVQVCLAILPDGEHSHRGLALTSLIKRDSSKSALGGRNSRVPSVLCRLAEILASNGVEYRTNRHLPWQEVVEAAFVIKRTRKFLIAFY
jgi:hypothetical protein